MRYELDRRRTNSQGSWRIMEVTLSGSFFGLSSIASSIARLTCRKAWKSKPRGSWIRMSKVVPNTPRRRRAEDSARQVPVENDRPLPTLVASMVFRYNVAITSGLHPPSKLISSSQTFMGNENATRSLGGESPNRLVTKGLFNAHSLVTLWEFHIAIGHCHLSLTCLLNI